MPVLCDFEQIVGDSIESISNGGRSFDFDTGGRRSQSRAFLLFNVRGLINTTANVRINGNLVGSIIPYPNSNNSYWYTQMISVAGSQLNDGNNTITLDPVGSDPFDIKNMVCFFHQST